MFQFVLFGVNYAYPEEQTALMTLNDSCRVKNEFPFERDTCLCSMYNRYHGNFLLHHNIELFPNKKKYITTGVVKYSKDSSPVNNMTYLANAKYPNFDIFKFSLTQ